MVNSYLSLPPDFQGKILMYFFLTYLFYFNFFYGHVKKFVEIKEYSEYCGVLSIPLLLSVVHLVTPLTSQSQSPPLDYFEANAGICDKNFCLHRDILEVLTVTHVGTKARGEEHFKEEENGEEKQG